MPILKQIIRFFMPKKSLSLINDFDVEKSIFEKYGWYYNTTERCHICNKLIYKGILPKGAEYPCIGHKTEKI